MAFVSGWIKVGEHLQQISCIFFRQTLSGHLSTGETGLLLSKVSSISPFFGYAGSKSLTEKKLMRDVFAKGDVYFNTGDLMVEDQHGFICFRDRVGDTYRCGPETSVPRF